jgi:putative DNA primase/helicase
VSGGFEPESIPRTAAEVFALRQAYWHNGYRSVPIHTGQKRPRGNDWRNDALLDPPLAVTIEPDQEAMSTGIITGEVVGIDVDIFEQPLVDRIVAIIERSLGITPLLRIGFPPKILLVFRGAEEFTKLSTGLFLLADRPKEYAEAKLEILATGQQFVADGIHPDTGRPYSWPAGSPDRVPLDQIPPITLGQAQAIIAGARELLIANGGVEEKRPRKCKGNGLDELRPSETFFAKVNEAALRNLAAWVKVVFPKAVYQPGTGAWRVKSKDRGRPDLEEDISLHPDGIQDFGLEQGLTPIDVLIEHGGTLDAVAAAHLLCERLGIEPAALGWHQGRYRADPPDNPGRLRSLEIEAHGGPPAYGDDLAGNDETEQLGECATPTDSRDRPAREQPDSEAEDFDLGEEPPPKAQRSGQTILKVIKGEYVQITARSEAIAIAAKLPIYSHGEALVRPVTEERQRYDGQIVTVAVLRPYNTASLRRALDPAIGFAKFDARRKTFIRCEPPEDIINMVLAGEHRQVFPPIRGIIGAPILRPGRTIITAPGYDPETGYYLVDPPKIPPITAAPTEGDAERALATLADLLSEFPFVDGVSKSVAFSGLITPLVRAACDVVPGHLFTAPKQGSGKSLLVDIASAIATGERAYAILAHRQPEEQDKQLTGALLEARQFIALDNLTGEIEGTVLAQVTERERISVRPLGTSKTVAVVNSFNTYLTGNNVTVAGDNTRRLLVGRVDPQVENPLDRRFEKPNPVTRVFEVRGEFVAACLTIVLAYIAQGRVRPLPPIPSYAAWSELVREPLVWLGLPDPANSMRADFDDDPNNAILAALMQAWPTSQTDWTCVELIDAAMKTDWHGDAVYPGLANALKPIARDRRGVFDANVLGNYLRLSRDKIVGGRKIARHLTGARGGIARWCLA